MDHLEGKMKQRDMSEENFHFLVVNSMQRKLSLAFYIFSLLTSIPFLPLPVTPCLPFCCQQNETKPYFSTMKKSKLIFVVIRP